MQELPRQRVVGNTIKGTGRHFREHEDSPESVAHWPRTRDRVECDRSGHVVLTLEGVLIETLHRCSRRAYNRGRLVAELMAAATLGRLPQAISAFDLADLASVLLRSGVAPLAWWGLRSSALAGEPIVGVLHNAYRTEVLRAALANVELEELFRDLSAAGLDVIIGKGWSIARSYPSPGLRVYGDFDLYCRPHDHQRLRDVLARRSSGRAFAVDAHPGLSYLDDRDVDAVFLRSIQAPLGSTKVRVFGAEDQLRLTCLHTLAEGVVRPTWLCDIAVLVATIPPHFNWEYFGAGARRRGDWCRAAVALAHEVLGVNVSDLPASARRHSVPRWLGRSVLATWGCGPRSRGSRAPMDRVARRPRAVLGALVERWPLPVEATVGVGGPINAVPRLPYEIAEAMRRSMGYFRRRP